MADFHHPKLRLLKGDELTHQELDNNINSFYYSSSLDGSNIKLYAGSTSGSFSGYTQSYDVNAFTASHAISASYALTASYALSSSVEITLEHSSSYAESASFADTSNNALSASHFADGVISASVNLNTLTLKKADNSTLSYLIHTGSGEANPDGLLSSSAQIATDISGSLSNAAISALEAGIVSASAQIRDRLVSAGAFTSASNASIRATLGTNQFILSGSKPNANTLRLHPAAGTNLDYVVGGEDLRLQAVLNLTSSILLETGSVKTRLNTLEAASSSYYNSSSVVLNTVKLFNGATSHSLIINTGSGEPLPDGLVSSSAQINGAQLGANKNITIAGTSVNLGSTISLSTINAGSSIVSSSVLSNPSYGQGLIRHSVNSDDPADTQASNLSKTDSPVFDGITRSGSTNFGSGSNSNNHLFTGSVYVSGALHLGGGGAIGNDITGAFWQGYPISSSKIDFATGSLGYSLNDVLNKKFEKATFDNTSVELTLTNATGSTVLSTIDNRITGLLTESGSVKSRLNTIEAITGSITGLLTESGSVKSRLNTIEAITGSLFKNAALSGSSTNTIRFTQQDDSTIDVTINTGSNIVLSIVEGGGINVTSSNGVFTVSAEAASATNAGITEYASTAEMTEGVSTTRAVTPANYLARSTALGVLNIPGLLAATSSYLLNTTDTLTGNLTVTGNTTVRGTLTAQELHTEFTSASILFESGSTKFGDTNDDNHAFTGSLGVTGDITNGGWKGNVISASKVDIDISGFVSTSGSPEDDDFAKFTNGNTVEGRSIAQVKSDLDLEIGTDVLAQQTIGIADNNLLEVDDADAANDDYAKFTANGLEGRSYAEVRSDLGLGTLYSSSSIDTAQLDNDAVTYAKMQNVSATNRILGRDTAGAGNVEEITPANLRTMINVADGANNYSHPNHSGDVTSTGDGATVIAADKVTYAKMQNIPTANILGRVTAGTGNVEDLTATQVRTLLNVADGATNVTNNNQITNGAGYTTATGTVDTSGTPANQQIPIFTDANTISGSSHLRMHVNGGYPQFGGLIVGDGPDSNLYIGAAIEPSSADVGIRLHSTASGDFYFDFQGDTTQTLYYRDYDGSGGSAVKFTFDFQNSNFATTTGTFSGNVTANNFITTSDRELKKNIEPIKAGLETLKKFVSYEYELEGNKDAGFIAQEVQESLPYAVHKKDDGYLALDTKPILAHMHKAILEIDQRLSAIEEKLK